MSFVIENTYCSPKFINLKRSLFWQTYSNYKCAIGLGIYLFVSIFSSGFAQSGALSLKNKNLLSENINLVSEPSDQLASMVELASKTGNENEIYNEGGKFFNRYLAGADIDITTPKYTISAIAACSNVTSGGTINASNGQPIQVSCSASYNPSTFINSVSPSGGSGTTSYQWQSSADNYNWTDISGATSSTYNPPTLYAMTYFRRLARKPECTTWVPSNVVVIVVNYLPGLTLAKTDPTCAGNDGTITVSGSKGFLGLRTITYQRWDNIGGSSVSNLTSNANFPNSPTSTTTLSKMEADIDQADNFGGRMVGYITPNITGTYYFWIASDDNGELWLSTNEDPANKEKIAYHNTWTNSRDWNSYSTQKSVGINLVAGQIYYIEALYKEGGGGDNMAIGWAKPGQSTTAPSEVIPIDAIRPFQASSLSTPTYQYQLNGGTFQSGNVFTGLSAGIYTIVIKDVYGCTASGTITLTQNNATSATASNNGPLCAGQTINLTGTSTPTAGASYQWKGPNGFTSSEQSPTRTNATSLMSGTYTLTVTFGSGCAATATATTAVTVAATLPAPGGTSASRCGTGSVSLSASGCSGTYAWYTTPTGGSSIATGSSFTTPSISSTTNYYVECTMNTCTSNRTLVTATVNANPDPTATGDTECEGSMVFLGATGGTSYNWAGPNGFASSEQNPTIPNGTPNMSGVYTVTVANTSGCTATATASVLVKPVPATPTGVNVERCGAGTITLTATGCNAGTYKWYANATTSSTLATGATYTTPNISSTTTYHVSCTINDCVSNTRKEISAVINEIPAAPTTKAVSICGTGTVTLSATNCTGTVNWYSAASGGSSLGAGSYTTPTLTAPSTVTYYADCKVNNCTSTSRSPLTVTVLIPPTASASNTGVHCVGTTFKLIGGGNGENFSWRGPNGFSSSEKSPLVFSATAAMSGIYTLTVTASNGCTTTATTNMVINSSCTSVCTTPIAVVPTNPTSCGGTSGKIFVTEYTAGPYYENSLDGITWYNSERTYSNLPVGYYNVFIRDKSSKIVCRTISATLTSITSSYYTGETVTPATGCAATDGKIVLQGVLGTDNISWISSTTRSYVKVSSLSPSNTISNLSPGEYYVIVARGGNPLCYSERRVIVGNNGTPCPAGLCTTTKNANLFPEGDFGSGSSVTGPSLAPGESQYSYAPMNCDSPNDGNYTITNTTDCNGPAAGGKIFTTWDILPQDHTPGDVNGYMMIVNASYNPDIVIERTVTNLCPNTRYEYSLWIYNLCPASDPVGCTIKPNLTFLVDGVGKYTTGTITASGWQQVGFTFTTGNSTTSTFSIRNNAEGGQGNDWAIDDISIIQCLPTITQSANIAKCIGTTNQTISATVTDGSTQYSYYKWQQSADGGATWSDLTGSATATFSAGTYTATYTLPAITAAMNGRKYRIVVGTSVSNLNNSSCSYNGTETTLSVPTIIVSPSANPIICSGSSTTISASASGGTSPYTYLWSNDLGNGPSKTVNPGSTTIYTVTATDANGCSATATLQVTVKSLPAAPTAVNGSRCGTGTVSLNTTGCSGTVTWYASLTGTSSLAVGSGFTTPGISTTTKYYANCTVNDCVSDARTEVVATINPIPTASATGDITCVDNTISLSATGGNTYNWVGPAGFSSNVQNPSRPNVTLAMAGTYTVTVISAEGCTATATASVVVNPAPTPTITGNNTICVGESTTLTASGGESYVWSTGETTTTINVAPATTTTYTVTAYTTNSSYTNLVIEQAIFNATNFTYINSSNSYAGPQSLFDGIDNTNAATFHATRINNGQTWGIGYKLGKEYLITSLSVDGRNDCCTDRVKGGVMQIWKNGSMVYQSNVISGSGNGVISANPAPNVIGDEVRYVFLNGANTTSGETTLNFSEWIIGGAKVCSATKDITVTVNPKPGITIGSNSPVCAEQTLSLSSSGGASYSWKGSNGYTSSSQNPSLSGVTASASGIYTVTVSNSSGCSATATTSVVVNTLPGITIGSNSPVCAEQTLSLSSSGGASYSWKGPNGYTSSSQNPSLSGVTASASGIYTVTVTNSFLCSATAIVNVVIYDLPTPPTVTAASRCDAGSVTLTAAGCSGGVIQWYDAQTGGNLLGTGITFATNTLTQSTFYFASCFTNQCSSPTRTAGLARINSAPNAEVIPINSTCIADSPQNNARLLLNRYRNDDQYSYNLGASYNSAMASTFVTIPAGGLVPASNLPNPIESSQTYTVRIKNAEGCTVDRTVSLTKQCEECPKDYCLPVTARKTK